MVDKRTEFSWKEKVTILRGHSVEKLPLSDLCDEYGSHPTLFYLWQKTSSVKGTAAFENDGDARSRKLEKEKRRVEGQAAPTQNRWRAGWTCVRMKMEGRGASLPQERPVMCVTMQPLRIHFLRKLWCREPSPAGDDEENRFSPLAEKAKRGRNRRSKCVAGLHASL